MSRLAWRRAALALALLAGAALALALWRDSGALVTLLAGGLTLDPWPLVAAYAIQSAGWLLVVDTWRRLLTALGAAGPFRLHLRVHTLSGLAGAVPGSLWQPASRLAGYRAAGLPASPIVAGMAVEWLLLGLAGLALYALAAPFAQLGPVLGAAGLVAAGAVALLALEPTLWTRALGWAWRRFGAPGEPPRLARRALAGAFLRELAVLALAGLGLAAVMRALGPAGTVADALAITGLTLALANLLAWLPASSLIKDASMVLLLVPVYGGQATAALAVVVVWRVWLLAVQLSWAGLALGLDHLAAAAPAADGP